MIGDFDPGQLPAAEGVPWLVEEFMADPGPVVEAVVRWVVAPAAAMVAAVWAGIALAFRRRR